MHRKFSTDIVAGPSEFISFTVGAIGFTLQCATDNISRDGMYLLKLSAPNLRQQSWSRFTLLTAIKHRLC